VRGVCGVLTAYLSEVLYHLAYYEEKKNGVPRRIDYRDLSVRHLGSLYEGILEYKLFIAEERMVRREEKNTIRFLSIGETTPKRGERIYETSEVYFAQSKGERKATGSYYTPEDVVTYIVDNTNTYSSTRMLARSQQIST
jgi:hypothetical protein